MSAAEPPIPNKYNYFEAMLEQFPIVCVDLVPGRPGVVLPERPRAKKTITLQYGKDLRIPLVDFKLTDTGIEATMSFAGEPHDTLIPWSAIFQISEPGMTAGFIWWQDVPKELMPSVKAVAKLEKLLGAMGSNSAAPSTGRALHPGLRLVPMEGSEYFVQSAPRGDIRLVLPCVEVETED